MCSMEDLESCLLLSKSDLLLNYFVVFFLVAWFIASVVQLEPILYVLDTLSIGRDINILAA